MAASPIAPTHSKCRTKDACRLWCQRPRHAMHMPHLATTSHSWQRHVFCTRHQLSSSAWLLTRAPDLNWRLMATSGTGCGTSWLSTHTEQCRTKHTESFNGAGITRMIKSNQVPYPKLSKLSSVGTFASWRNRSALWLFEQLLGRLAMPTRSAACSRCHKNFSHSSYGVVSLFWLCENKKGSPLSF